MTPEQRAAVFRALTGLRSDVKLLWRNEPELEAQARADIEAMEELLR